ncbi:MAG TPA: hypothetical protein DCW46_07255 [Desulfotomaculum sp.]|nr:hypothetical protein [Desulfotomaculum sp.]
MLLSILFLVAAVAEAASVTKQVSINQVIKLIVNGKTISTGTNGEPVILKGRTFVPIGVVAEALNLKVDWALKLWSAFLLTAWFQKVMKSLFARFQILPQKRISIKFLTRK